jgi:1-acyl-sn-glycerol-3-phosphate acyltransferase
VRLTNVLAPAEGDSLVGKLTRRFASAPAGRDPNVQYLALQDAAGLLALACESDARGVFNGAPDGVVTLKRAFAAAGIFRLPSPRSIPQLEYNWTVSSERARRELDWRPRQSTAEALAEFVARKDRGRPELLDEPCDEWGMDRRYIRAWAAWFWFLRNVYWRIEHEGFEHIPAAGRALFVSNHRGFMPLDAVMHLSLILKRCGRIPRFLIIHSLLRPPFLSNFLTKLGGVIASQENAARLFACENLVGIFPEGIRGAFSPYRDAYRLRDFSKSGFARIAIENQAPVIPAAVVGHAEIFPILARIESSYITREWGWPCLPIAPMFPLAPVPLPSKWHVRVLPAVSLQGLRPSDAANPRLVREFSTHVQRLLQQHIDEMCARRQHIFWGRIFRRERAALPPNVAMPSAGGGR